MKVVQINAVCGFGSTGRICMELSEFMNKNDIENHLFFGNGENSIKNAYRLNSEFDTKLHALLSRVTGKQAYFSFCHTRKIIKQLERIKPDIVHLHNLHGNYIHLNMLLKYLAKKDISTVITLHDCWFYTGKCTHYTIDSCYKWKIGCYDCPRLKKDNPSWFFDRTRTIWKDKNKYFNAIPRLGVIGVSDWITNEAKQSFLKDAKMIKRIYNWIDLDIFYPRVSKIKEKYGIPENKFIILMMSAGWDCDSTKFQDMLKLSELLDQDMQIIVVGKGLEKVELPGNITRIGYINSTSELAELFSCADVYVHVSREDTFGKVVAESMACGTPAMVYDSTALPELIGKGCGYVVACGNIEMMSEKIKLVKENGKDRYSNSCVNFVKANFDKEKLLNDTISLYEELLN